MIEEDKKDAHPSYKEEDYKIIIDRNAEKMENHQNQLEILMHQKNLWEMGGYETLSPEMGDCSFPREFQAAQAGIIWWMWFAQLTYVYILS